MVTRDSLNNTQMAHQESDMHVDRLCGDLELVHSSSSTTGVQTFMTGEIHEEDNSIGDATEEAHLDLQVQGNGHRS